MSDQRRADAALVSPVFVFAERRVAHVGPASAVGNVGIRAARHHSVALANGPAVAGLFGLTVELLIIPAHGRKPRCARANDGVGAASHQFGATAVVLQEENQRVLPLPLRLQLRNDPSNALVHAVDLRGIDLHATALKGFVLHGFPLLGRTPLGPSLIQHAQPFQLRPARGADVLVSAVVTALVFCNVGVLGMQRPVRRRECGVEEEWLSLVVAAVLPEELHRVIRDGVGVIELLRLILRVVCDSDDLVVPHQRTGIKVAARAVNGAIVTIEAALQWPVARVGQGCRRLSGRDMPFANGVVHITRGF